MKHKYGLIGYPLSHSFSPKYFSEKFQKEGIKDTSYELFPLEKIEDLKALLAKEKNLRGLNVTAPYKEKVIPFLDELSEEAAAIEAVNTIHILPNKLVGHNSDVFGFEYALSDFLAQNKQSKTALSALVLGTGGAAKSAAYVLKKMGIDNLLISRSLNKGDLTYSEIDQQVMLAHQLIVNTTPLGMPKNLDTYPPIPYENLNDKHLLFDMVYNPEKTVFLERGIKAGCAISNGLMMLHHQANKSWEIWQTQQ